MAEREAKPAWSAVPEPVRRKTETTLGERVIGARRAFGGYGPSATFVLFLESGARAFFKGVYPLPVGSSVRWMLAEEERIYRRLRRFIEPWAPAYHGSIHAAGWHALLLEAIGGERVLPWTRSKARRAARSYAEFHAGTVGRSLPKWLDRDSHLAFARYWGSIAADRDARDRLVALAGIDSDIARDWIATGIPALVDAEQRLAEPPGTVALLHFDTRSDNIRLQGDLLRMFDWPLAFAGPAEFDLAAFAQSIASEGGPDPDEVVDWYAEILSPRTDCLVAAVAGIAGYFADRAPRPDLPGLPRLRSVQRRQLKASLRWAARRLGLPAPDWLASVPD